METKFGRGLFLVRGCQREVSQGESTFVGGRVAPQDTRKYYNQNHRDPTVSYTELRGFTE